jgi:4-amino-4-deoxychorismate lyase
MLKTCFETIRVKEKKLLHVEYHQKRVDYTRKNLFGLDERLDLKSLHVEIEDGALRVDYDEFIQNVTCREIPKREFKKFKVQSSDIEYKFKYTNRDELNSLKQNNYDDIIISNEGVLKDTTIANIALMLDGEWFTPIEPLLFGTTRDRLIRSGFLKQKELKIDDLKNMQNFAIMNSLLDFKICKNIRIDF